MLRSFCERICDRYVRLCPSFQHGDQQGSHSSFDAGANLLTNCWGPVVGAKIVKYRTAAILGTVGQTVGMLAFGPSSYALFGGFLTDQTKVQAYPELTLYAIAWTVIAAAVWQCLAIWQRILVPTYIGTGKNKLRHLLMLVIL